MLTLPISFIFGRLSCNLLIEHVSIGYSDMNVLNELSEGELSSEHEMKVEISPTVEVERRRSFVAPTEGESSLPEVHRQIYNRLLYESPGFLPKSYFLP